jgi:hypothetical protein
MAVARDLHPITRACMGLHLWSLAGLGRQGDRMEAAVTAGRISASEGKGAVFAPLAMGGAGGLHAGGAQRSEGSSDLRSVDDVTAPRWHQCAKVAGVEAPPGGGASTPSLTDGLLPPIVKSDNRLVLRNQET